MLQDLLLLLFNTSITASHRVTHINKHAVPERLQIHTCRTGKFWGRTELGIETTLCENKTPMCLIVFELWNWAGIHKRS